MLTNVEQYMGSNTRSLTPTVVNETRFGYTRFYNSTARELAGVRDVVKELAIPGLNTGAPITWGIPSVGSPTAAASATIPKVRTRTRTTRCSS